MREFETGATRDDDTEKYDYEGFINPLVLERFAQYMHGYRKQADGKLRDSDNWQNGIPTDVYMKSMLRHVMALWKVHRGYADEAEIEESLCAIVFNAFGYLFNLLHEDDPELLVWADECAAFHDDTLQALRDALAKDAVHGLDVPSLHEHTELDVPSLHEHTEFGREAWTGIHQHGNMMVHEHHSAGGVTWSTWDPYVQNTEGGHVITLPAVPPTTPDPDDAQTVANRLAEFGGPHKHQHPGQRMPHKHGGFPPHSHDEAGWMIPLDRDDDGHRDR